MRSIPQRPTGGGGGGGPAHQSEGHSGGLPAGNSSFPALIAFGLQNEGNITLPDTSAWAEVSEDYWWARGRLAGGGMLSITYTPPECGCLSLSTYYALPVGNLTLVVGPQAYPDELQILLCMDPLPETPALDEYEDEEEEEEDVGEYIQEPSALVAPKTTGETDTEAEVVEVPNEHPPVTPRKKKPRVGGRKRKTKKTRRQMKRQRIRQAGRRQARRQQRQEMRQEDEEEEGEEGEDARRGGGFKRAQRRWKQKRKGRKAWRKLKKNSRRGRRRFHGARQHHGHHEEMNGTSEENMTDHHHHHHHPHHFLLGQNVSEAIQQEERLIDVLLRDEPENSTMEQQQEGEEEEGVEGSSVTEEEGGGEGEEVETPRQRRKNRRQRKKMMRKERRKPHYPPGVKFCCKQGVKHKKNILEFNTTSENSPGPCNATSELVSNFANHQFDIEVEVCDATYSKCCFKFTADMWNAIKSRKMARRRERKERRKSRRLDRKHRRQNERRMRKEMMRQSRHQHLHVTEGPKEEDPGRQGEGDAALE